MKIYLQPLIAVAFLVGAPLQGATIVSDINDLSFSYGGGTSENSQGAGSLVINSAKNSYAYASMPGTYDLEIGETFSVTMDVTLDNTMVDTSSSFALSFSNSTVPAVGANGGTIWDDTYFYGVVLLPQNTNNGITFDEGDDSNLGKFDEDQVWGTSTHTLTFTLERTGAEEMTLSFASPTLSSTTRSVNNDIIPLPTTSFDTFGFTFRGNGWNEQFPASSGNRIEATIANFSIDTTGTLIPEPSGAALLAMGLAGFAWLRRRRS